MLEDKIKEITGGHDKELCNLRRSLVALWKINNPKLYSENERKDAYSFGEKMWLISDKIEKTIQEEKACSQTLTI